MPRLLALCLVSTLAFGCVKPPPVSEPDLDVSVPDTWTAPGVLSGDIDVRWWTTFKDPQLDQLIELALLRNLDLQAAVARVDRSAAEAKLAGADLKPTVDVGVDALRQRRNFLGFPLPGNPNVTFNTFNLTLSTSWEVDLWGRVRAAASAAVADFQASEADLYGARLSLAGRTAKLWFAIAEAQDQVELASGSAESFREVAEQVRTRYERGVRPALDLRLALSNLAGAEAALQSRKRQLDASVRQLEVLLAVYPDATLPDRFTVEDLPPTPPPVPAGLPAELVARRPDLISAERLLAGADKRFVSARRARYPRLSLTAAGGTATDDLNNLLDGDFGVWSLFANLTQPIFQAGRIRANIDRARATKEEVLAFYGGAVLQAYSEVEFALASENFLRERERHLADSVKQLVAAERLADERYRYGVGGYLEILESQTRAFITQAELLSVKRARLDNRVDLYLALGGGFTGQAVEPGPVAGHDKESEQGGAL